MGTPVETRNEKAGATIVRALKSRHMDAFYCDTIKEATEKALSLIPEGSTVSWGGSVTIKQIGLTEKIHQGNFTVLDRDLAKTPEEKIAIQKEAAFCDVFLMSANAISEDGLLVNMDGNGNRLAALICGPKNVIVIAGMNKVCKDYPSAVARVRGTAAPCNAQRFDINTPCKNSGTCEDCKSLQSICVHMVTTRLSRPAGRIKVILVGENLGF